MCQEPFKCPRTSHTLAIDIREGQKPDEAAFMDLIRSAIEAHFVARARRASPKK